MVLSYVCKIDLDQPVQNFLLLLRSHQMQVGVCNKFTLIIFTNAKLQHTSVCVPDASKTTAKESQPSLTLSISTSIAAMLV